VLKLVMLLVLLAAVEPAPASTCLDSGAAPYPYVTASRGGSRYLKMVPDNGGGVGTVYKVGRDSDIAEWKFEGWYAFTTFLSSEGRFIARMGDSPSGDKPSPDHLAVAFYDRGVLVKQYSTRDLIEDDSKVEPSASHYQFWKHDQPHGFTYPMRNGNLCFSLITIDGIRYLFEPGTGEIVEKRKP
jgi:hypothetical protein